MEKRFSRGSTRYGVSRTHLLQISDESTMEQCVRRPLILGQGTKSIWPGNGLCAILREYLN